MDSHRSYLNKEKVTGQALTMVLGNSSFETGSVLRQSGAKGKNKTDFLYTGSARPQNLIHSILIVESSGDLTSWNLHTRSHMHS